MATRKADDLLTDEQAFELGVRALKIARKIVSQENGRWNNPTDDVFEDHRRQVYHLAAAIFERLL